MRTVPSLRLVVAMVASRLEEAIAGSDFSGVGRGVAPGGPVPYLILYSMPSGQQNGNLSDPYSTEPVQVQVSAYGRSEQQALFGADLARFAIYDGTLLPPSGWRVMHVSEDVGGGVPRQDATAADPIWKADNRYRIWVTPDG